MNARAIVEGLVETNDGLKRGVVFYGEPRGLDKIQEAVESAFDKGATLVIIRRKAEVKLSGKASK